MRIPYKIYQDKDNFSIKMNELIQKYLYCPNCFLRTVDLRSQPTFLSILGFGVDRSVYFCYGRCNKIVNPLTISEVRENKIKIINE